MVDLRRLVRVLDGRRIPLSAEERSFRRGPFPYWGANGVIDQVDAYLFDETLVLIGEDGAPFFDSGRDVAFVVSGKTWVNNHMHVLRPNGGVDPRYLAYSLNAVDYGAYITGSTRDKLTQRDLLRISIREPPLVEQGRIADYLDELLSRIHMLDESTSRQVQLLRTRRRAFIESRVSSHFRDYSVLPLSRVYRPSKATSAPDSRVLSVYRDHGVVPKDSRDDNFNKTPEDTSRYLLVQVGDLVVNRMKAWQGSLAVSRFDGVVSPDYEVLHQIDGSLEPDYLNMVLRMPSKVAEYGMLSTGIRPSQWRLYWEQFKSVKVPVPPPQVQREVGEAATIEAAAIESALTSIARRSAVLAERRRALIVGAVTGQFDVTTASGLAD